MRNARSGEEEGKQGQKHQNKMRCSKPKPWNDENPNAPPTPIADRRRRAAGANETNETRPNTRAPSTVLAELKHTQTQNPTGPQKRDTKEKGIQHAPTDE